MKHRRNKVKREHGIIQNALHWLESLSRLAEVTDIIPGVIDVNRSSERGVVYKYETQTGCKLLLKSNGSIQEAFVITKYPERVQEWVNKEFPTDTSAAEDMPPKDLRDTAKKKLSKISPKPGAKIEYKQPSPKGKSKKQKRAQKNVLMSRFEKDKEELHVADHLDNSTLKALKRLKQSLENVKIDNSQAKGKRNSKL